MQRIQADLIAKDNFKIALENCQVEAAYISEKPDQQNTLLWFAVGAFVGATVGVWTANRLP